MKDSVYISSTRLYSDPLSKYRTIKMLSYKQM